MKSLSSFFFNNLGLLLYLRKNPNIFQRFCLFLFSADLIHSMSQKLWFLILNLLLLGYQLSYASSGSRSILRAIRNEGGEPYDYAVDLNATVFDSAFRETPAAFAVVEFYAHW